MQKASFAFTLARVGSPENHHKETTWVISPCRSGFLAIHTETIPGLRELLKDKTEAALKNTLCFFLPSRREWRNSLCQTNPATNVDELVKLLLE